MSQIAIEKSSLKNGRLTSKVTFSPNLKKYIRNEKLFLEYEDEIYDDESILNIPLTATILPLAWLTGSDVMVGSLDKTFKESMDRLQDEFSKTYPLIEFKTKIYARELVENKIKAKDPNYHTGILFSGGVDSTYSLVKNLHLKPKLIMIWGVDNFPYPERQEYWTETFSIYKRFAENHGLDLLTVKTNISQILNGKRITHRFHKEIYNGNIRESLQHSLILLPAAAPLSFGRFDHLLIAASGASDNPLKPRAARPKFDEKIIWGDLRVEHHGFISRNTKIHELRDFLTDNDYHFKVCLRSKKIDGNLNDSSCEKCLRTILSLVLAEIDPNVCGFKVDESTFATMKDYWLNRKSTKQGSTWVEIQKLIPEKIDFDIYGSKEFLEWFRDFDLGTTERSWFYSDLYTALPFQLASILDNFYHKMGINVHEAPKKREVQLNSNN